MSVPTEQPLDVGPGHDGSWQRLDRRMLVVHPTVDLVKLVPLLVVLVVSGGNADDRWRAGGSLVLAVLVLVVGASRWFTTTYRIDDERVELRTGLLRRRHRSVHRDRVRTADLTATPAHRLFGLAVVRVGTGSRERNEESELRLDAVGRAEAERLRALLLGGDASPEHGPPEVARFRLAWVRFAPLTFSALAVVGAVWAGAFRIAEEFGWQPRDVAREGGQAPVWLGAVALVVTAVLGAAVVFVEGWWGYRLTRRDDGGLMLRRGLLTRRTLSLEGRRIRGVELDEPLLLRLGRGARPLALTTGLRATGEHEHVGALAPAVSRREARRIAAAALGTDVLAPPLDRHPRAALVRRFTRALAPAVALAGVALLSPSGWPVAAVLVVGALVLAWSRWSALGHALTSSDLVSRHGALVRRTVVLRRGGVIGWRLSQSFAQRRAGLVTLHAVSAAGRGRYEVLDVGVDRAIAIVEETNPGMLAPFLVTAAEPTGSVVER